MAAASVGWRPVVRAALTSGVVMAAGDVLCQTIRARGASTTTAASTNRETSSLLKSLDWKQSARFGLIGLTLHGPWFYRGFRWLDSRFGPAATLKSAATKTLVGQCLLFPPYLVSFFTYVGILEGLGPSEIATKVRAAVPATFAAGTAFWPVVNVFNFMFIKPAGRVLYVNAAGLFWNAWLSWENSTRGVVQRSSTSSKESLRPTR